MARNTKNTSMASTTVMGQDRQGEFVRPPRTANVVTTNITRGDVVKSSVTKGFRPPLAYSASGQDVSLPFVDLRRDYTIQGGKYWLTYTGVESRYYVTPMPVRALISQNQINAATVRLLKQIGDAKFSAGQALAELQESADMIGNASRTIAKALTSAIRKDWKGVARALGVNQLNLKKSQKTTANGWLAYSFGWSPLVEDISNAALALSGHLDRGDVPLLEARVRIEESADIVRSQTIASDSGRNDGTGIGAVGNIKYHFTDTYKASVYYEVSLSTLNELSRYGLVGLSTPWAILPWSFLVDWILPIGDILAAADATMGLTYKGGSYTRFRKCTASLVGSPSLTSVDPWQGTTSGSVAVADCHSFDMNRAVWATSPSPFQPYVKNPFSFWKAITGIALLRQVTS